MDADSMFEMHEFLNKHEFKSFNKQLSYCVHCLEMVTGVSYQTSRYQNDKGYMNSAFSQAPHQFFNIEDIDSFKKFLELIKPISVKRLNSRWSNEERYSYKHPVSPWSMLLHDNNFAMVNDYIKAYTTGVKKDSWIYHYNSDVCDFLVCYATIHGYNDLMIETINGCRTNRIKADFCKAIGKPLAMFRPDGKNIEDNKYWYYKVDKPYYDNVIKKLEVEKQTVWAELKPYFTKGFGSPEHKAIEYKHTGLITQIKGIEKTKRTIRQNLKIPWAKKK